MPSYEERESVLLRNALTSALRGCGHDSSIEAALWAASHGLGYRVQVKRELRRGRAVFTGDVESFWCTAHDNGAFHMWPDGRWSLQQWMYELASGGFDSINAGWGRYKAMEDGDAN